MMGRQRAKPSKRKHSQLNFILTAIAIVAFMLYYVATEWDSPAQPAQTSPALSGQTLEIHFIDAGQGDSILIKTPGSSLLIDAGTKEYGPTVYDYLKEQKVNSLDYIINTHPHADHVGGMAHVISSIGSVGKVIMPGLSDSMIPTTRAYETFLDAVEERNATLIMAVPGKSYDLGGGALLTILGPTEQYDDMNDNSVVCRLDFGNFSCLLTGDSELRAERDILDAGGNVEADVLKLGHHGSSTSTDGDWLSEVNPELAVVSCGLDNSYGHPHREVTAALEQAGVAIYRTDLQGSIVVTTNGQEFSVATQR